MPWPGVASVLLIPEPRLLGTGLCLQALGMCAVLQRAKPAENIRKALGRFGLLVQEKP